MKFDKKTGMGIAGILTLALVITLAAKFAPTNKNNLLSEESADNTQLAAGTLTEVAENASSGTSAGALSEISDYSVTTTVDDSEIDSVGNGIETDDDYPEGTVYGYTNIGFAQVDEGNLNVRKTASSSGEIVGKMTNNNACEVEGTSDDGEWYKISSGNVEGYVSADYIVTGDEAVAMADDLITTYAVVDTDILRVRAEASTDSKILDLVSNEDGLVAVSEADGWVEVELDDENGYVSEEYVTLTQKFSTALTMKELNASTTSGVRYELVQYALQFVGNPYVWGGTSLTNGIDCSGFTMQIYARYGISLPHSSRAQPAYGTKIDPSDAQPGDLFFYGSGGTIGHVAIYIGNGQIVHASNHRDGIKISNAFYRQPICVVRYLN